MPHRPPKPIPVPHHPPSRRQEVRCTCETRVPVRDYGCPIHGGPMNLGPKDELLSVKRDTLESLLVAMGNRVTPERLAKEANRLERILREAGE